MFTFQTTASKPMQSEQLSEAAKAQVMKVLGNVAGQALLKTAPLSIDGRADEQIRSFDESLQKAATGGKLFSEIADSAERTKYAGQLVNFLISVANSKDGEAAYSPIAQEILKRQASDPKLLQKFSSFGEDMKKAAGFFAMGFTNFTSSKTNAVSPEYFLLTAAGYGYYERSAKEGAAYRFKYEKSITKKNDASSLQSYKLAPQFIDKDWLAKSSILPQSQEISGGFTILQDRQRLPIKLNIPEFSDITLNLPSKPLNIAPHLPQSVYFHNITTQAFQLLGAVKDQSTNLWDYSNLSGSNASSYLSELKKLDLWFSMPWIGGKTVSDYVRGCLLEKTDANLAELKNDLVNGRWNSAMAKIDPNSDLYYALGGSLQNFRDFKVTISQLSRLQLMTSSFSAENALSFKFNRSSPFFREMLVHLNVDGSIFVADKRYEKYRAGAGATVFASIDAINLNLSGRAGVLYPLDTKKPEYLFGFTANDVVPITRFLRYYVGGALAALYDPETAWKYALKLESGFVVSPNKTFNLTLYGNAMPPINSPWKVFDESGNMVTKPWTASMWKTLGTGSRLTIYPSKYISAEINATIYPNIKQPDAAFPAYDVGFKLTFHIPPPK